MPLNEIKAVLCLSGHDPTGGAGVQADIETLRGLGCHPLTLVTALTVQDTVDVLDIRPQKETEFLAQADCLLGDMAPAALKIGLLGSCGIANSVAALLSRLPQIPVVLDPILAAGGGKRLARAELMELMKAKLFPQVTLLTPNTMEARELTGRGSPDECAAELIDMGCKNVLITGTHETGPDVVNRLYGELTMEWPWPRLPHTYHGSGCTLAAALAALLAQGWSLDSAAYQAQRFTYESLRSAYPLGRGQYLPNRTANAYETPQSACP